MSQLLPKGYRPNVTGRHAYCALTHWLYAHRNGAHRAVIGYMHAVGVENSSADRGYRPRTLNPEATDAILRGMEWLGLDYDGEAVFNLNDADRHAEVAHHLLSEGKAYVFFRARGNSRLP